MVQKCHGHPHIFNYLYLRGRPNTLKHARRVFFLPSLPTHHDDKQGHIIHDNWQTILQTVKQYTI